MRYEREIEVIKSHTKECVFSLLLVFSLCGHIVTLG